MRPAELSNADIRPHPAIVPGTIAAIVLLAIVAAGMAWGSGGEPAIDDRSIAFALFGAFVLVALSELIVNRLFILPTLFDSAIAREPFSNAVALQTVNGAGLLSFAFSTACGIYGAAFAVLTHEGEGSLVLPVIGLVMLAVNTSYINDRAAEMRQRLSVGA